MEQATVRLPHEFFLRARTHTHLVRRASRSLGCSNTSHTLHASAHTACAGPCHPSVGVLVHLHARLNAVLALGVDDALLESCGRLAGAVDG